MDAHPPADGSQLHEYLRVVRRGKWILLAALVLVPGAAVVFSLQQKPKYEATAQVLLSRQNFANSLNGIVDPSLSVDPNRLPETQSQVARVPAVAQAALRAVGSPMSTDAFLGESGVSPSATADILTFHVTDPNRALAAKLATEYAQQYIAYSENVSTGAIDRARKDVDARIQQLQLSGDTRSALYASLVEKDQQLATMAALQTANATLVHAATSAVQVEPKPTRDGILGLVLGLVLGLGLVFLRQALDTRVHSADEVEKRLGLPLLGRIPAPPRRLRQSDRLVTLDLPTAHEAEPFRVLRTNLDFVNLESGAKTIMVTSALAGEGKSTTAANLAVALAESGRHVVLVDLDLRRPYVDRFFDLNGQPGLTAVALGKAVLSKALAPAALSVNGHLRAQLEGGKLEVLRTGILPPNPGEFANSRAVGEILSELAEHADVVLIDAPPLLGIGDALALSAKVDALILVTRLKMLRRGMLNELSRLLGGLPAQPLGFVVTDAGAEDGYGYGYGYYDYYRTREPETVA